MKNTKNRVAIALLFSGSLVAGDHTGKNITDVALQSQGAEEESQGGTGEEVEAFFDAQDGTEENPQGGPVADGIRVDGGDALNDIFTGLRQAGYSTGTLTPRVVLSKTLAGRELHKGTCLQPELGENELERVHAAITGKSGISPSGN